MDYEEFWCWFCAHEPRLRTSDARDAADALRDELAKVNRNLGVEVADDGPDREVVVTAGGQEKVFDLVRNLVRGAPLKAGWRFTALKPPGGFAFEVADQNGKMNAADLYFEPMQSKKRPDAIGICIFIPDAIARRRGATDLARIVVETGVGEEAASKISYIDVGGFSEKPDGCLPIQSLGEYLRWKCNRTS